VELLSIIVTVFSPVQWYDSLRFAAVRSQVLLIIISASSVIILNAENDLVVVCLLFASQ
jgi:hypothetical protein